MRLMLKFKIPVEKGNETAADGTMGKAIQTLVETTKAEASYFFLEGGERAGIVVFEESDQARMAAINEPFFAAVNASIEIQPVLTAQDLQRTLG